jgi:hypothetical protein
MHKSILSFFIFSTFFSFSQVNYLAEGYDLKQSEPSEEKTGSNFIGKHGDYVYTAGSRKGEIFLQKIDGTSLNVEWSTKLETELKKGKTVFEYYKTVLMGNSIHVMFYGYNKKENDLSFVSKTYNLDGTIEKSVVLAHIPVFDKDDFKIKFLATPDKKHAALRVFTGNKSKAKYTVHLIWLNEAFETLEHDKIRTNQIGAFSEFKSEALSNNLQYALAINDKTEKNSTLHLYNHFKGKGHIEETLKFSTYDILNGDLAFNPNKQEVTISGYYGVDKKKKDEMVGFFHIVYNANDFTAVAESQYTISEAMGKDLIGERRLYEKWNRGDDISFRYHNTYYTSDGGSFVVYEDFVTIVTQDRNGAVYVSYQANDILVMRYDSENNFDYYTLIAKEQFAAPGPSLDAIELQGFLENDELHLYFTMSAKLALKAYPDKKVLEGADNRTVALFKATATTTKEVTVEPILIYRVTAGAMFFNQKELGMNESTDEMYFSFIGGGYQNKNAIACLKEEK